MITVIKKGNPERDRPQRVNCRQCESELEFIPSQDAEYKYDQRDGGYWSFSCPVCNHLVTKSL